MSEKVEWTQEEIRKLISAGFDNRENVINFQRSLIYFFGILKDQDISFESFQEFLSKEVQERKKIFDELSRLQRELVQELDDLFGGENDLDYTDATFRISASILRYGSDIVNRGLQSFEEEMLINDFILFLLDEYEENEHFEAFAVSWIDENGEVVLSKRREILKQARSMSVEDEASK